MAGVMPAMVKDVNGIPYQLTFELVVAQQPDRARMCGFGDKVCRRQYSPADHDHS